MWHQREKVKVSDMQGVDSCDMGENKNTSLLCCHSNTREKEGEETRLKVNLMEERKEGYDKGGHKHIGNRLERGKRKK